MSKEQNTIEKIYNNPKARKFFNHLVRSYLPLYKTKKVFDFKDGKKHECSICGKKLFDVQSIFNIIRNISDKILVDYVIFLEKQIKGEETNPDNHPIYKHIPEDSVQAWTGENTNTFLCIDCVEDLINKVQNGILTGDKNIIWAINKMKREEFFDLFKNSDKLTQLDKSEIDKIQKEMENYLKNKISTFGGLELLKKFKEKMEGENEKIKKI